MTTTHAPTTATAPNLMGHSDATLLEMFAAISSDARETIANINENYSLPGGSPAARDKMRSRLFHLYDQWSAIEKELDRRNI